MARANRKGRSKGGGQFVPIPHNMARSAAWRSLSGAAAKVYVELRSRYNGRNNGDLSLSYREAAGSLRLGKTSVKRAFDELQEKGFLVKTSEGRWYGRKAATWAATDKPVDHPRAAPATNAWKAWRSPAEAKASKNNPRYRCGTQNPVVFPLGADKPAETIVAFRTGTRQG